MKKYYVLKKKDDMFELLDVIVAKNLSEAKWKSTRKYLDIILTGKDNLIVVGKSGYYQYYKQII